MQTNVDLYQIITYAKHFKKSRW